MVVTDVSGRLAGPIFKAQEVQGGPIGCPEMSVTTSIHCVASQKIVVKLILGSVFYSVDPEFGQNDSRMRKKS